MIIINCITILLSNNNKKNNKMNFVSSRISVSYWWYSSPVTFLNVLMGDI